MNINNRLSKIEQNNAPQGDINNLIGKYWDVLTKAERKQYCRYYRTSAESIEKINLMVLGTLHFKIDEPVKMTLSESVSEIEDIIRGYREKTKTPC